MGAICGFAGDGDQYLLQTMLNYVRARGPADADTRISGQVGLAYNREQPRAAHGQSRIGYSADCRVACVLDGFLFNADELRDELQSAGVTLRTDEPTELIANWFARHGAAGFERLDGGFALAVAAPDGVYLVRDALGEKPFYFTQRVDGVLMFSSEVKSFLAHDRFECEPDGESLNKLLTFSFVPGEATMFKGVCEVLPGSYVHYKPGQTHAARQTPYWDLTENVSDKPTDETAYVEQFDRIMTDAVRRRTVVEGEYGAFLSGGLDSSAVVAYLSRMGHRVTTFSVGFGQSQPNELMYAKLVADHCGTKHHVLHVEPGMFLDMMPRIMWTLDDPLCDCIVVPNYLLAIEAGRDVKLLFNGEGGDPLFGGPKNKFLIINEFYKHLDNHDVARSYLASYHKFYEYIDDVYTPEYRAACGGQEPLDEIIRPYLSGNGRFGSFLNKLMYINTKFKGGQNILVKVDKMLSAHALPVMSPLFDKALAEYAFTVPPRHKRRGDVEKYVFKKAVEDMLPHPVVYRKKAGMGVPLNYWFKKTVLRDYAHDLLTSRRAIDRGYFDPKTVRRLLKGKMPQNAFGQNRSGELVWMLLAVELWHQVFIDQRGLA